jgi:hypothetical protein
MITKFHIDHHAFMLRVSVAISLVAWVLSVSVTAAERSGASRDKIEDHLLPVSPKVDEDLRAAYAKKLFVTRANYGRLLIQPPFEGECAISVYSKDNRFYVTLTRATRSLAQATVDQRRSDAIHIARTDAEIPKSTAVAIQRAWQGMLSTTRSYDTIHHEVVLDAENFEFSLTDSSAGQVFGQAPAKQGKLVAALIRIGKLLIRYCEGASSDRQKLIKQIQADATRLAHELKAHEKR